jgi:hypothetical protein
MAKTKRRPSRKKVRRVLATKVRAEEEKRTAEAQLRHMSRTTPPLVVKPILKWPPCQHDQDASGRCRKCGEQLP